MASATPPTPSLLEEPASFVELVEVLEKIDANISLAELNATSIVDNNGGRIEL